ncbi:hypothetical protein [Streptomyces sp. NPDC006335]|uniref:hypothetical protein n=1 Tax=Streptomyces sp. NPDC006335 TaxID=3156895 RepID=UPI0033A243FA
MSEIVSYLLSGNNIEVEYQDGELRLDGDDHFLKSSRQLSEIDLTRTETEIGTLITGVLLDSSRNGTKVTISVLLPDTQFPAEVNTAEIKSVAIITDDYHHVLGSPPPVLYDYEIRPLTGTAFRTPQG